MKKFLTIVAVTMLSAQTGYCAGPALESLNALGNMKSISVALPDSSVKAQEAVSAKISAELPADRKVEGIGIAHSGTPFDIPYFSFPQIARLIKEAGGTHYRPHMPLNEALPHISKADMARLKQAINDPALLDAMIDELSKNGRWERMDGLVNAFTAEGMKLILVSGAGYRKEAPLYEKENGSTRQISPDRVGKDIYVTFLKWAVGAGVRRYADKVFVWQVENELNANTAHMANNWRIIEGSWTDVNFQRRMMRELSAVVHAEGAKRGIPLKTVHTSWTAVPGWEAYVKWGQEDGIDIVGADLYPNYYLGQPIDGGGMARDIARAKEISGGRPVWILETGYARAPLVPNLFAPDAQAYYFKTVFERCFRAGADVILAFGWFWNPSGWFMDGIPPLPGTPMAAEPYWSPIEMRKGKPYFNAAWKEFEKAAAKWHGGVQNSPK